MKLETTCAALWFCSLLAACTGKVSAPREPSGAKSTSTGGGSGGTGGTGIGTGGASSPVTCNQPQASTLNARLLSPSQYDNTAQDILQVTGDPAKGFTGSGFAQLDDSAVEQRANAAAAVAQQAATTVAAWAPCSPTADATACEQQIIERIGGRAFRRPLTANDRQQMTALFDAGIKEKNFATGVEWFLTGLLQAPDFLYLFAKPAANETPGQVVPIEAHDMASRLAYFVWDSTPDDALLSAADSAQLNTPEQLRSQLERMVGDQRFMRGVSSFYSSWLNLAGFAEVARDDKAFTGAVVASLSTSLLMSATQIYSGPSPNISALFSGETYPLDATLRGFYGRPGTGDGFVPVTMDAEERHGIITHPGLMTLMSRPDASNPIARGLFVRRTLLCQQVPAPPAGLSIPPLPPISPGLSTRDRLNEHTQNAVCQACHDIIDPPGFALESFDEVGRFRTVDSGKAVDTSGDLTNGGDVGGSFADGGALLSKLVDSHDVRSCFAQQYLQHALSRSVGLADQCSVDTLGKTFAASGDLKGLVVSVAASDAFRMRLTEGVAP